MSRFADFIPDLIPIDQSNVENNRELGTPKAVELRVLGHPPSTDKPQILIEHIRHALQHADCVGR
jgi:hypothetical protein